METNLYSDVLKFICSSIPEVSSILIKANEEISNSMSTRYPFVAVFSVDVVVE